jgi:hypothetical protein
VKKIAILIALSSSLAFATSLTGSWKIDKAKTVKVNKRENKMAMNLFALMNIYANNTVEIPRAGLKSKLHKNATGYSIVVAGSKVPVTLLDANHLTLKFSDTVYYNRVSAKAKKEPPLKSSQVKFKLEKIYKTKIKNDYAFLLLAKDRTVYFLQTNRKNHISIKEIKSAKLNKNRRKNGFTYTNTHKYTLKGTTPYLLIENTKIDVLSPKKLKYQGHIYRLQ